MATTYNTDIQKLYVAYFNRPADPAGLAFWETAVEAAKGDTSAVSAAFAGSAEYKAAYANMTNAQVVNAVYLNLFSRPAEDAGKAYWADLLDKKTITIDQVVTAVAGSAQGSDATAYSNKVAAAAAFTALVDTDAEAKGYSGDAAIKEAKAFLAGITDANSLSAATAPAALNATVSKVVAAGTPFTVAGALASLDAAQTAYDKFVASVDVDSNPKTATKATDIADLVKVKDAAVAALLSDATAQTLYAKATTSDATKAALIQAQVSDNAKGLSDDQKDLSDANTAVSKVDGLSAALTTLTAAKTSLTAAQAAEKAADADLAAKLASFKVTTGTLATDADGNVKASVTADGKTTVTTVATIDAKTGLATVADGVDASKFAGLSAYLGAFNADVKAAQATDKADAAVESAQLNVNHLDIAPKAADGTLSAEQTALNKVTDAIANTYKDVTIASGATASEAQISTELAILKAKSEQAGHTAGDVTNYNTFKGLVDTYHTAAADNPLVAAQVAATAAVKADNDAISAFTKAVAALNTSKADAATLDGYQATVEAAEKVFADNHYSLTSAAQLDAAGTAVATANSDVFVAGAKDATISLFGLQGTDSLFVGAEHTFTLVKGAIDDKGVVGNDAKFEIFVSSESTGTQLQIETTAFGSSAATHEVVTIHLVGVDADSIALNNGIITGTQA